MASVEQLYQLWADESALAAELDRSLDPRGVDWLFDVFAGLGPEPGQVVLDAGARDARHAIRLVRSHGLRAIALDPVALHAERARDAVAEAGLEDLVVVVEARLEEIPLDDRSVDFVWCRDVLVHVDQSRGLAECARVLRPGGRMLAYVTLATERLEPREAESLIRATALVPESLEAANLERAAERAGLTLVSVERIGGEWRERMIEDGSWDPGDDLLRLSRLRRREAEIVERHGDHAVEALTGGLLWGVYQLLGKLCPTVYVWERRA
jgi:SAM-dependent methyltransferase